MRAFRYVADVLSPCDAPGERFAETHVVDRDPSGQFVVVEEVSLVRHRFEHRRHGEVWLYLPAGQPPTARDFEALGRMLEKPAAAPS